MSLWANRVLFSAIVGVLVALVGAMVLLASNEMIALATVVLLAPICLGVILVITALDRKVHSKWIELDCLPPYRTRRYE